MQLNIEYIKLFEHEEEDYQLKNILIKLRHRGNPHCTYTQKSPKLAPPPPILPPCSRSYAFDLTSLYAYILATYSPPPLQINFYSD